MTLPRSVFWPDAGPRKLERFLAREENDDEVVLLSEPDGFIAGIVVCPGLVMPGEWLGAIRGDGPVLASEREARLTFSH